MRGQRKYRIWPAYFNARYSRNEGRRVPREKAVRDPSIEEIEKIAEKLDLKPILEPGASYPKQPWRKTGVVIVDKKHPKGEIIKKIAERLSKKK
jgi:signal recognition particle subunit SRP19